MPNRLMRLLTTGFVLFTAGIAHAGQPLETETTRVLRSHQFEIEAGFEHQRSNGGSESASPFAFGYGFTDRLEVLVEPVPFNRIRDRSAPRVGGNGDVEVTLTSRRFDESPRFPALAFAGEVKLPTARDRRLGSGKADFTAWAIASRRRNRWDTHANLGYTIVGAPTGVKVHNQFNYGLAEEFHANAAWEVVGEVFGNTAALAEGGDAPGTGVESAATPEIGSAETVGALGVRVHAAHGWTYSLGLSLDTNKAFLVHPGLTFTY